MNSLRQLRCDVGFLPVALLFTSRSWFSDAINIANKSGTVIVRTDDLRGWLENEKQSPIWVIEQALPRLVILLSGNPVEVVISTNPETLERHGQAFVDKQGSNVNYELCKVEIPHSEQMADLASIQGLLSTPQEMQVVSL
jgi:hypothetical protein